MHDTLAFQVVTELSKTSTHRDHEQGAPVLAATRRQVFGDMHFYCLLHTHLSPSSS